MSGSIPVDKRLARWIGAVGALTIVATMSVGCFCPCVPMSYDSLGVGIAYVDANCNGARDPDEAPLEGVCVWTSGWASAPTPSPEECANENLLTDSEGFGEVAWYSGSACDDVFVFAKAPDGYDPTTALVVNGCEGEFGFAPEGTCPPHRSVTAQELVGRAQMRCLAWAVGVLGVLVLVALAYRKFRRGAIAEQHESSGE